MSISTPFWRVSKKIKEITNKIRDNMKKTVVFSLILFLCYSLSYAADDMSEYFSNNKHNGRYWNSISLSEKSTYISGMSQAITLCIETVSRFPNFSKEADKNTIDLVYKALDFYLPQNITVGASVEYIDRFYSDPLNLDIPVNDAYACMILEGQGLLPGEKKEETISNLRGTFKK